MSLEALQIESFKLREFIKEFKNNAQHDFDVLVSMWGRDLGEKIEISYLLHSSKREVEILLVIQINADNPQIESICDIYKSANWDEREIYDLLGVKFINHPNLERLLLPKDWIGHPLRQNYEMKDDR